MGFRQFLQSNNKLGELKNEAKKGFRIGQHLDNADGALALGSAIGKAAGVDTTAIDKAGAQVGEAQRRKSNIERAFKEGRQ